MVLKLALQIDQVGGGVLQASASNLAIGNAI
jgi:hypothetical protein